jgi:glutathione S-transferase
LRDDPAAVFITIRLSHYCEKARWGLDRVGYLYREEAHVPLLHRLATRRNAGSSVPVLVDGDRRFTESSQILAHADAVAGGDVLYPREPALRGEVAAWEQRFDDELGTHVRRWAYAHLLDDTELLRKLWSDGVPRSEARFLPLTLAITRRLVRSAYRVTKEGASRSLERVRGIFGEVEAALRDGRRFLVGDRFTAADLTLAALAAPALFPAECRAAHPPLDAVPEAMREEVSRFRETVAGQFAMRIYAQERDRCVAPGR